MNWTEILKKAGIPEPPGYRELVEDLKRNPPPPPKKSTKRKR